MMLMDIVVATRNRSSSLINLLESIGKTDTAKFDFHVWIVDNNSTDSTAELVKQFVASEPSRYHYIFEGAPGKSHALNRGIRESSGEIVVFTDDDCIPDSHWLENIATEFSSRPDLGFLGGRIELHDPQDLPITLRTSRERRVLSNGSDVFSFIAGCNMAMRRGVIELVGEFDTRLGPGAPRGTVADDPDYVYRAFRKGVRIEYVPEVLVFHNHGRRSDNDARTLRRHYLRGRGAFYAKHILKGDTTALKMAYWELRPLLVGALGIGQNSESASSQRESLRHLLAGMAARVLPG